MSDRSQPQPQRPTPAPLTPQPNRIFAEPATPALCQADYAQGADVRRTMDAQQARGCR